MESVFGRYRNLIILVGALFLQVIALGVQVRRPTDTEPTRLIRVWVVSAVTPLEKGIVRLQSGTAYLWHNYFYLRGVRQENRDLKAEIQKLRLEQVRLNEDAGQARRLQTLLAFKEQFISKTVAAQVIGSSGSEQSRVVYIDKGSDDHIATDMAVITSDGVVGKVLRVFDKVSQVLLINDQTSGVGAILQTSRLQGVLRGTPAGEVVLEKVMSDEKVQPGEEVFTSGGDRIFPKGLKVGVVTHASPGSDLFLNIHVKPSADLSKLEEVLVVTQIEQKEPAADQAGAVRAIDILTDRLPSVPPAPVPAAKSPTVGGSAVAPSSSPSIKPQSANAASAPASLGGTPVNSSTQKAATPAASGSGPATAGSTQPHTVPASAAGSATRKSAPPTAMPRVKPAVDQTLTPLPGKSLGQNVPLVNPRPQAPRTTSPAKTVPGDEPH
jgi:rod shape-determining protein MreC